MAIKRSYMKPIEIIHDNPNLAFYQDGRPGTVFFMQSATAWENYFREPCTSEFNRVKDFFTKNWVEGHLGPYGLTQTGTSDPLPTIRVDFEDIRVNNSVAWKEAKKPGSIAIVVSPFQRGHYTLSQSYGAVDLAIDRYSHVYHAHGMASLASAIGASSGVPSGTFAYRGLNWAGNNSVCRVRYARVSGTFDTAPGALGFPFHQVHTWAETIPSHLTVDSEMVTDVLADANSGTVDLLTSLAEAPKTFSSILSGCMQILRMYKEARKGEVRLHNKAKKVRLELDRLKAKSQDDWKDVKEVEHRLTRIKTLEKNLRELLSAAADVWLQYRLNIYPNVKNIEASLEGLEQLNNMFIRYRDFRQIEWPALDFPGWTRVGNLTIRHRCMIKRGAQKADMFGEVFTTNPFLTAWELVPLSFVVDRYMNIGSFIAALAPRNSRVTEGATVSWKVSGAMTWTHVSTGASVTLDLNLYKRSVIDPSSYICIPFPQSRSVNQHLDHLALAWNLLIKKL